MGEQRYEHITRWNVLLDELCNRAGFLDTASLASRFCELSNKGGQREFETAIRNLNNWRSGRHIPRLRSLRILEQLLKVEEDPELSARWHALYRQASEDEEDEEAADPAQPAGTDKKANPGRDRSWPSPQTMAAGALLFCLGVGTGALLASDWRPWGGPADNAPLYAYTPEVRMVVGESRTIHAERGDCGKLPREWPEVFGALPAARTGVFSDGGLARRNSKFCKGITPARAIVFTATTPGVEEFLIQGDFFKVTVTEAAEPSMTGAQAAPQ
ncbi:hypothetical protein [Nitratireductor sp. ZSWI3]|uniref:hypothetical protein n=1 Tax=Nitratireductor sp. ZSWI3 TaxID=2966359 RepID=UPI00214F93FD|nr:hypothetical protein [Nitratireductor sp. ZSWI3]MCR4265604.1 hypothetical protein [Nitratireductor sp. ZSWI3]